jgi:hypothetical protein
MAVLIALLVAITHAQRPTIAQLDEYRKELRPLLDAIRQVESNGDDKAIGDSGNAIGAYQIWRAYWQDATDWCQEIKGSYESCHNRVYAERIVVAYWHRYARSALRSEDYEVLARVHNGGPKGHRKMATLEYWAKVSELLED